MSATPRTDAQPWVARSNGVTTAVSAHFARQLELEIEDLKSQVVAANERAVIEEKAADVAETEVARLKRGIQTRETTMIVEDGDMADHGWMTIQAANAKIAALRAQIHDMCHDLHVANPAVSATEFCAGCERFQVEKFGQSPIAQLRAAIHEFNHLAPDIAQLFTGWHCDVAWTPWDQSVFDRMLALQCKTDPLTP